MIFLSKMIADSEKESLHHRRLVLLIFCETIKTHKDLFSPEQYKMFMNGVITKLKSPGSCLPPYMKYYLKKLENNVVVS